MFGLSLWLNLAAIACLAWGITAGYQTYQRELGRAHGQMRIRFSACAGQVYETHAFEAHRLQLLKTNCIETLDDDRWVPVFAPNLSRDTAIDGFGPAVLALVLAGAPVWAGRWLRPGPIRNSAEVIR